MSIYDKSSLVLIPSGTKTGKVYSQKPVSGDGDFTFTRSSAATRVNADGNIEKETQNLLLQSNTFTSTWNVDTGVTFTSGQSGYDGSNNAWKMDKTASEFLAIRQTPTYSGVVTFSVYAKEGTLRYLNFYHPSTTAQVWFDLQTGGFGTQAGSYIKNKIEDVGGGWYRCSVTYNASSGGELRLYPTSSSAGYTAVAGNIYIQDAQLEQGLVARDVITTTTTAVEGGITDNVPRLDYTDSSCPALLLEPQRSNIMSYSEYFGAWDVIGGSTTITANNAISPEGVDNAYLAEGNGAQKYVLWRDDVSVPSAGDYVISAFFKYTNNQWIYMAASNFDGGGGAFFDIQNGVVGAESVTDTASVEDYGNGWYRCSIKTTIGATDLTGRFTLYVAKTNGATDFATTAAANGQSVNIWGAQLEAGSYATSYIPTYGSSVTRTQDKCYKTGVADLIGDNTTIFVEFVAQDQDSYCDIVAIDGGATSEIIELQQSSSNGLNAILYRGGFIANIPATSSLTTGTRYKAAFRIKTDDFAFYLNGVLQGTDTSGTYNGDSVRLNLSGYGASTFNNENAEISSCLLFNTALSNEELEDLTTL